MAYIQPPDGRTLTWHKGPPPSVGWWPASVARDPRALRWWDGTCWSNVAWDTVTERTALNIATLQPPTELADIEWSEPWWN